MWLTVAVAVAASDPEHPAHTYFRRRHDRFRAQVAEFASKPDARNVGMYDPETRAVLYMAVLDGLRLEWLIDPTIDVGQAARRFSDLVLQAR